MVLFFWVGLWIKEIVLEALEKRMKFVWNGCIESKAENE